MRVLIMTPVLNAIDMIDATILSVISQIGDFHLHYHLRDLGSTDGTVARLAWWQERLDARDIPLQCLALRFDWAADHGAGLGAALSRGFAALPGGDADFMTWLDPGNLLMPGALALAASLRDRFKVAELGWFGGAAPQGPVSAAGPAGQGSGDPAMLVAMPPDVQPMPTAVLAAGLSDGRHWDRLEQPGVFFRRSLWAGIAPQNSIASLDRAAPYAIWRALARHTAFVRVPAILGRRQVPQHKGWEASLSGSVPDGQQQDSSGNAEEAALLPPAERRDALLALAAGGELRHRLLCPVPSDPANAAARSGGDPASPQHGGHLPPGPRMSIVDASAQAALARHLARVLGPAARPALPPEAAKPVRTIWRDHAKSAPPLPSASISLDGGIAAFEGYWQFPAITEEHAARQMQRLGPLPAGVTYVAYPWATLIDKLQSGAADAQAHLRAFRSFCRRLPARASAGPGAGLRITVCQHILLRSYLWLLQDAGIDHVFWSHATQADVRQTETMPERGTPPGTGGIGLHPFPLYPVQVPRAPDLPADSPRPWLFSFIGARANRYYLTEVRNWILDSLSGHPSGRIEGRDSWHYNSVVYDQQIRGTVAADAGSRGDTGPDSAARTAATAPEIRADIAPSPTEAFLAGLTQTVFALCPSGTGPNSIRLWEALGAGTIPVILADGWAPPGDRALWEAAALFVPETPAAVAALPDQLAAIAADLSRLAAMRAAGRQLWLLYGPDSFVTDIRLLITRQLPQRPSCEVQAEAPDARPTEPAPGPKAAPAGTVASPSALIPTGDADPDLLQAAARALLLGRRTAADIVGDPLLARARRLLAADHPAVSLLDRVLAHRAAQAGPATSPPPSATTLGELPQAPPEALPADPAPPPTLLTAPMTASGRVPVICLFGRHANRTPLAYAPFRRVLGDRLAFTADPGRADLVMTGYNVDLPEIARALADLSPARRPRLAIISEEPLWDSIWSGGFADRARSAHVGGEDWPYAFLNHHTSTIFAFDHLPYFLLTRDDFAPRLALWILRQTAMTPAERIAAWQGAAVPAAFVAERREDPRYARAFPELGVAGLSVYRSEVARLVSLPGTLRMGRGWSAPEETAAQAGGAVRRQDLRDWHIDKIAQLDGRVRVLGAQENTHQRSYVSEKVFDAFAIGAMPLVHAGPGHRLHDLIGAGAMLNSFALSAAEAAGLVEGFVPGPAAAAAWLGTAHALVQRLADVARIEAERARVIDTLLAEVASLL